MVLKVVRRTKGRNKPKARDPSWNKDYWGPVEKGKQLTILLQRHHYSKRAFREFLKTFQIKKKRIIKSAEQKRTVSSSKIAVGLKLETQPKSKVILGQAITESIPWSSKPAVERSRLRKVNGFGKSSPVAKIFSERSTGEASRLAEKGKQAIWDSRSVKSTSETKGQTKGKSILSNENFSKPQEKREKISEIDRSAGFENERRSKKTGAEEKQKRDQAHITVTSSKKSVSMRDIDEVPSSRESEKTEQEKITSIEKPITKSHPREFSSEKLPMEQLPAEKPVEKEPPCSRELKTRESKVLPSIPKEVPRREEAVQSILPTESAAPSEKREPTEKLEVPEPAEPLVAIESVVEPPAMSNRGPVGKMTRDQDIRSHRDSTEKAINVMPDELFQRLSGRARSDQDRFGKSEFETHFGHLGRRKIRELEAEPKPEKGERVPVLPTKPKNPSE